MTNNPLEWLRERLAPSQYLMVHFLLGLVASIISLFAFSALAHNIVTGSPLAQFDLNLANALHARETPLSDNTFLFISLLGRQVLFVVVPVIAIYYAIRRQWLHVTMWIIVVLGGQVIDLILKQLFERPRPIFQNQLITESNFSFPSGHAMESFVVYGMLAYFLILAIHNRKWWPLIILATTALVVLIGIARIYLGVHYFSDVLAGYAAGAVWLSTCITAMEMLRLGRIRTHKIPKDKPLPNS